MTTEHASALEPAPPPIGLMQIFLKFLGFGCFAFGGPVAQIAMLRQALVEEEKWLSADRFNRLLAVMQALPGPEAHELCVHFGMMARGRIGGVLAGLGFMLPGFALMLGAAALYARWIAGQDDMVSVMFGVQIMVLAMILRAVHRIGAHALADRLLWALAGLAFIATFAGTPFWLPLIAAGLIAASAGRPPVAVAVLAAALALAVVIHLTGGAAAGTAQASLADSPTLLALFMAGLKGGLLTFGGAYTAIPYVRGDTVSKGWLSDATFLDGVALAGVLPAPLVIFVTFAGFQVAGWQGALVITLGMFLPAFAFSLIFFERLEALVAQPALHRLLQGVAAAVVGVIAATWVQFGWAAAERATNLPVAVLIFAGGVAALWMLKGRWVMPALVVAGAGAGWLLRP